jgi:uncharacterized membrane protein
MGFHIPMTIKYVLSYVTNNQIKIKNLKTISNYLQFRFVYNILNDVYAMVSLPADVGRLQRYFCSAQHSIS